MPDDDRNASERSRFDVLDREIIASQVVAVIAAHWACPDANAKLDILRRAERQITTGFRVGPPVYEASRPTPSSPPNPAS